MEYIRITKENIDKEHICCAMSGKQSLAKKEWLKQRFEEGLVFYRSAERGKCFIEYIPAENAWVPIDADGYLYINCLWVSGSLKGHGYSSELLEECLRDAKAQGKNGVCILCAEGRKREFLADPKFLTHRGFKVSDISDCGINLMYLPLAESAQPPKFKACAKHPKVEENGFVLYYTDQCPYTYYWVPRVQEAAKEHGIPFKVIHITDKERLLFTCYCQIDTFLERISRSFQRELLTDIPEFLGEFLRPGFNLFLIVTVNHHGSLVPWVVSPNITDPDPCVYHSGHGFNLGNQCVQRFRRLDTGTRPFAGY